MPSGHWRLRWTGGLIVALLGTGPVLAQAPAPAAAVADARPLLEDIQRLRIIWALGLTRNQVQAMLPYLRQILSASAELEAARRRLYLSSYSSILAIENAMLTHQSPDERALQAVREGGQWLTSQRADAQRKVDGAVSEAARFLTAGQRAAIELDEPHNRRLAWQTTYRRAQTEAVQRAQTDLEGWVKSATEDAYVNDRDTRLDAVLKAAYPNSNFDLQEVKKALGDYYDAVRKLAAVPYAAERPRFRARLALLLPLPLDPQASTPGVCSVTEWTQLLSDPRTYDSLVALLNVLPLGDRP